VPHGIKYPWGPPLESHISHVIIFPVNQYREAQLKIILNTYKYNKDTTYTGAGETDGFQYVYCVTPVLNTPEATWDWVGCTSTLILISFLF